jgi:tRNA threonylcarbamoyl adenosine modification protein (Sua5/YciO/YrdC/YwlC family)
MIIEINPNNIDSRLIQGAVDVLKKGGIIIFPTDTVYAMGCDLFHKKALNNLARLKNTKLNKTNFSVICHDLSNISDYVKPIDRSIFKLLKNSLPGPFTFILTATAAVPKLFDSKKKEIGIRVPDNPIILEIVKLLGNPIATTSLHNEEDEIQEYFTDASIIYERFAGNHDIDLIIDGGVGRLEGSTVVDCTNGVEIIRQGLGILEL